MNLQWLRSKREALCRHAVRRDDRDRVLVLAHVGWRDADMMFNLLAEQMPRGACWGLKVYDAELWQVDEIFPPHLTKPAFVVCTSDADADDDFNAAGVRGDGTREERTVHIKGVDGGSPMSLRALEWSLRMPRSVLWGRIKSLTCDDIDVVLSTGEQTSARDRDVFGSSSGNGGTVISSFAIGNVRLPEFKYPNMEIHLTNCNAALVRCLSRAAVDCAPNLTIVGQRSASAPTAALMPGARATSITMQHGALDVSRAKMSHLRVASGDNVLRLREGTSSLPTGASARFLKRLSVNGTVQPSVLSLFANLTHLECFVENQDEAESVMSLRKLIVLGVHTRPKDAAVAALRAILSEVMSLHSWPQLEQLAITAEPTSVSVMSDDKTCMHYDGVFEHVRDVARAVRVLDMHVTIRM